MTDLPLSQAIIVSEALALMNEGGIDQVSLRKVAARLGIRAPSLYWHVKSKAELFVLMADTLMRECIGSLGGADDTRAWLQQFGVTLWRVQTGNTDFARLLNLAKWPTDALERIDVELTGQLGRFGVTRDTAAELHSSVQALVTGWAGFATGPNGDYIAGSIDIERTFRLGLDALIDGMLGRLCPGADEVAERIQAPPRRRARAR